MQSGTRLGRYEILSSLGAGAMGEVYRARDTKIKRDVAIKVLPIHFSSDSDRLRRFEQEVQAAGALNHPNILVIHDVGTHSGHPYVVSELLQGNSLREYFRNRALSLDQAIEMGIAIVHGLAAAHEKRIIHRDLKPENIFITADYRVKILDFGLAKFLPSSHDDEKSALTDAPTEPPNTEAGVIIGTIGYTSPEQLRGETGEIDHRSDIFSFGAVFFEILTGRRAFSGRSTVDTMSAILREDPLADSNVTQSLPPVVIQIVRRCLEKNPDNRFQSAKDLGFALEMLRTRSDVVAEPAPKFGLKRRWVKAVLGVLLLGGVFFTAFFLGTRRHTQSQPSFSQLTFRRGTIWSARFAAGEDTIVYSASFDGGPLDVFTTQANGHESRSLGLIGSSVLSVSSTGEIAILQPRQHLGHFTNRGTLAQIPLSGTTSRQLLDNVQEADWSPDGSSMAIVRHVGDVDRLEYPVNNLIYETAGWVSDLRVSSLGDLVAFLDHPAEGDNRGRVAVVGANKQKRLLSQEWSSLDGLAWSPLGDEVWFTARKGGEAAALYAVTLQGQERLVLRSPAHLRLHDISHRGRVLLSRGYDRTDFYGVRPGETLEKNLSWLDRGRVRDLSADGQTFIFSYWGEGSGTNYVTYLRKTAGTPPVRLGEGAAWSLSPDGSYVLATLSSPPQLILLPTGVGETKRLESYNIEQYGLGAAWLPDGENVLFIGREKNKGMRCYVQSVKGGPPRAITPEGVTGTAISPDGQFLVAQDDKENKMIYWISGAGSGRPAVGLQSDDHVIRWSSKPNTIFVHTPKQIPAEIFEVNILTGARKLLRKVNPSDATGIVGEIRIFLTPDGQGYVYDFRRYLSELYIADLN
jgi:eukaryotic-like serine/threonine-protein kinase